MFNSMMSQEQIGYMKTDDLYFYACRLEDERKTLLNRNFNVTNLEVEIAYVQREMDYRKTVAEHHQEYLKSNPEENEGW